MPNLTIRLEVDPVTRRRTIVVSYQSDPDALANEHEEDHRAIVQKLVEGGLISAEEAGSVRVERAAAGEVTAAEPARETDERRAIEQRR